MAEPVPDHKLVASFPMSSSCSSEMEDTETCLPLLSIKYFSSSTDGAFFKARSLDLFLSWRSVALSLLGLVCF